MTYNLDIKSASRGCQSTCSCNISSSQVQRFMSRVDKLFALSRNGEQSENPVM